MSIMRTTHEISRAWRYAMVGVLCTLFAAPVARAQFETVGRVQCANLIYGRNKSSECFASEFLKALSEDSFINVDVEFMPVRADDEELYRYPFAVMTGEGSFKLTESQRETLRYYLLNGGFLVASAGCSSPEWRESFEREMRLLFPGRELFGLDMDHPVFHTVYEIEKLESAKRSTTPVIQALNIEGRTGLIYSPDGLNDTGKAGGNCCCCGGSEIKNARRVNANIFSYALTH